jgi:hypothetical protein
MIVPGNIRATDKSALGSYFSLILDFFSLFSDGLNISPFSLIGAVEFVHPIKIRIRVRGADLSAPEKTMS